MSKIKALRVNPEDQSITPVEYGSYNELKALMPYDCMCLIPNMDPDRWKITAYCDDEGLLKPDQFFAGYPWYPQPIAGVAIITGESTEDGDDTSVGDDILEHLIAEIVWFGKLVEA